MDISWTWLGIVVLASDYFACASGFRRGFVKVNRICFFYDHILSPCMVINHM